MVKFIPEPKLKMSCGVMTMLIFVNIIDIEVTSISMVNIQPSYNSTRQVLYQVCGLWSDMYNSIYVIINYKEKSLKINTIMFI